MRIERHILLLLLLLMMMLVFVHRSRLSRHAGVATITIHLTLSSESAVMLCRR